MAYAIRLYFDADLEAALVGVWSGLIGAGVSPTLEALGDRPHVSVAGAEALDVSSCSAMLRRLAQTRPPFAAHLAAFGLFPGNKGVVYLTPTPSEPLLEVHREVHRQLVAAGVRLYLHFRPEGWVPHVTVAYDVPQPQVALALSWLHARFGPLAGTFDSIGLVEYYPIREIATFPLAR
jgi:2'-5' RNA ligase